MKSKNLKPEITHVHEQSEIDMMYGFANRGGIATTKAQQKAMIQERVLKKLSTPQPHLQ